MLQVRLDSVFNYPGLDFPWFDRRKKLDNLFMMGMLNIYKLLLNDNRLFKMIIYW